jgi:hypothetical protein
MAIWDKVKQGIDKAGKAAQDVFDEGKLRLDAYRAREQADKAAEALGYASQRLMEALRTREAEARRLEKELEAARASAAAAGQTTPPAAEPAAAPAPVTNWPPSGQ